MNFYRRCIQTDACSVPAGATVAVVVAVMFVVLGIIAGVLGFVWKKRQIPMLPS